MNEGVREGGGGGYYALFFGKIQYCKLKIFQGEGLTHKLWNVHFPSMFWKSGSMFRYFIGHYFINKFCPNDFLTQ